MRPAHQRLEAGDAAARQIDQRLIMRLQHIVLDRGAQLGSILRRFWARASFQPRKS